ncbi:MAG: DUF4115 domain-containing protein, partial [Alphaproteobacteria bacterium]|nr:DUF4115 domain-containing protein [Alphaproteobacteria bacterium]
AATQVPPAPVVAGIAGATPPAPAPAVSPAPAAAQTAVSPAVTPAANAAPAAGSASPPAPATTIAAPTPAMPVKVAAEDKMPVAADKTPPAKTEQAGVEQAAAVPAAAAPVVKPAPKKKKEAVIRVRAPKSRVTLRAAAASWVQISNAQGAVIYRKVLRQGEQYDVPEQPGLVLDTANAGGLEVFVDGKRVQNLGGDGEILRGIDLDPKSLKIKREAIRG